MTFPNHNDIQVALPDQIYWWELQRRIFLILKFKKTPYRCYIALEMPFLVLFCFANWTNPMSFLGFRFSFECALKNKKHDLNYFKELEELFLNQGCNLAFPLTGIYQCFISSSFHSNIHGHWGQQRTARDSGFCCLFATRAVGRSVSIFFSS